MRGARARKGRQAKLTMPARARAALSRLARAVAASNNLYSSFFCSITPGKFMSIVWINVAACSQHKDADVSSWDQLLSGPLKGIGVRGPHAQACIGATKDKTSNLR